jgi:glycosyltransferase involved in cell wall biosynthesis
LNILYIDHYAGGPAYGMEYRPFYLAREWVRHGHQVTIVAASQAHVRHQQPAVQGRFTEQMVDGIRHVWCATPRYQGNGVGRVINIFAFLRRLRQWRQWLGAKPDVVIASSTYPLDIGPARAIARAHSATLLWEVHDLWPLSPMELGGMSAWHPFIWLLQRAEDAACQHANAVVSMLPKADAHLRGRGMPQAKFHYVPNGIDANEWRDDQAQAVPGSHAQVMAAARARGHLLVLYAGSHGVANALHTVVDAATRLKDQPVTWLLVGGGPEKMALQQRAAAAGLSNLHLLEPVHKAAIPTLLRAADVLYLGLQRQSLFRFGISPNKLMDYMMAARPVICAIDAGNDIVGEAGCGLTIAPEDASALSNAVQQMASFDAATRERLGAAGHAYVQREHRYEVLAQRFLKVMDDAVTSRKAEHAP